MLLKDEMLPPGNTLLGSHRDAKKILTIVGLPCEFIHSCKNDCVLFRGKAEKLVHCPKRAEPRYRQDLQGASTPQKMMRYMPIIPWIKQLFLTKSKAMLMDWHVANKSEDGVMRGPSDSKTWQIVEDQWPQFKEEPRHMRLGLATDGVNPYSLQQSKYLVWPVVVLNYNLPPHLTMSNAFMWLALIIPGRR